MEIVKTFIVNDEVGLKTLYFSFCGKYFIATHIVGILSEISYKEAKILLNTPIKVNEYIQEAGIKSIC